MLAIGQEDGKTVAVVSRLEAGHDYRLTFASGDLIKRTRAARCEHDVAIFAPTSTSSVRCLCNRLDRSARVSDSLDFAVAKETDAAVVGRPERVVCSVCALQRSRSRIFKFTNKQTLS